MMIKVTPFINTTGSTKFKEFLEHKFTIDMLSHNNENKIFDNWYDDSGKLINNDNITLVFYPEHYIIDKNDANNTTCIIPLPITINDFINDMYRFNINIYWNDIIDEMFEPNEYLHVDEIYNYYKNLLTKLNKSHELQ